MSEIKPIALPGTHQKFLRWFNAQNYPLSTRILDIGAGHGAFSKQLHEMGFQVQACDLFPEMFHYEGIECKKVDVTAPFPYADGAFDLVIAIEVLEHVLDHEVFFGEVNRILVPGGKFEASTPNILNMKSRMRFLLTGFYYSFKPLELNNYNGLQHINARTVDQYNYIAQKHGFETAALEIDKKQRSSIWLMTFWSPFLWIYPKMKKIKPIHNLPKLLVGRLLFLSFRKK
ncbi:MAG: methyltransferase domain-containing protein [Saprospiraceae bacterium]|nr:methyltransferase domain-containing protein [Saprospiraceae bacterium]